jgi:hypothetical protein
VEAKNMGGQAAFKTSYTPNSTTALNLAGPSAAFPHSAPS